MIIWDSGTAVSGEGSVSPCGTHARLELPAIPTYYSQTSNTPPRYRGLGTVGWMNETTRTGGEPITYSDQIFVPPADLRPTAVYYVLSAGLSGTLYRGVEVAELTIGARIFRSTVQTIANATAVQIGFNGVDYDPFNMRESFAVNTRLVVPVDGWYSIGGHIRWAVNLVGTRHIWIQRSDGLILSRFVAPTAGSGAHDTYHETHTVKYLTGGQYVELFVFQDSGGSLNTVATPAIRPDFYCVKIGQ